MIRRPESPPKACHKCKHTKMIRKLHCFICAKCRVIVAYIGMMDID